MKTFVSFFAGRYMLETSAFHAEVRADGHIDRLMRVEDYRRATVEEHVLSFDDFERRRATADGLDCAKEGGNCTCDGVVLYGRPSLGAWQELRVQDSVLCTASLFDTTAAPNGQSNICRCFSLNWCQKNNKENFVTDTAHRRRNSLGTPGKNLHQRRRWCGWGPQDCTWSSWSKWSECNEGKECQDSGISVRSRRKETTKANGGSCSDIPTSESRECSCHIGKNVTNVTSAEMVLKEAEAQARINAVVRVLSTLAGGNGNLTTKVEESAMQMAKQGTLTALKLAKISAGEFVDAMRTMPEQAMRAGILSVARKALDGCSLMNTLAAQVAADLGYATEEVTIFRSTTQDPMSQAHRT